MSLMLAPYNDSMRIGMGFNSYTQSLCIDGAVDIPASSLKPTENPSQNVTYSAKFVEHLSEVVSTMQISHSSSIKRGTVEVAGNGDSINEEKIKASDVNVVLQVKVVNQTVVSGDNAIFKPLPGVFPGTKQFNDNFGDCYISGFITGGDFNGVVSMRVVDRSKTNQVVAAIKSSSRSGKGSEFTFDMDSSSSSLLDSATESQTETTITVSWMGGGQIKDPNTPWTLDAVYAAADAFPAKVAKKPQRTWAILTKYKANRSFVYQTAKMSFSPLEYDLVASFTSRLFDNYMDYKSMIKSVQDMIARPERYEKSTQGGAITLDVDTLVAVRSAIQIEMAKCVKAVSIIEKDPHVLQKSGKYTAKSTSTLVNALVEQSTKTTDEEDSKAFWNWKLSDDESEGATDGENEEPAALEWPTQPQISAVGPPSRGSVPRYGSNNKSYHEQWVWIENGTTAVGSRAPVKPGMTASRGPGLYPAWIETGARAQDLGSAPNEFDDSPGSWGRAFIERFVGTSFRDGSWEIGLVETARQATKSNGVSTALDRPPNATPPTAAGGESGRSTGVKKRVGKKSTKNVDPNARGINFDLLISPEIWRNVLPRPINGALLQLVDAQPSTMPASLAGVVPEAPLIDDFPDPTKDEHKATIEIHSAVCGVIDCTDKVREWIKDKTRLDFPVSEIRKYVSGRDGQPEQLTKNYLAMVFQYSSQRAPCLFITGMVDAEEQVVITEEKSNQYDALTATPYSTATWSILAVVYAGQKFKNETVLSSIQASFSAKGQREVYIDSALVQANPWSSVPKKSSVIFYQAYEGGRIRAAVGVEKDIPCVLTDSLASISNVAAKATQLDKTTLEEKKAEVTRLQSQMAELERKLTAAIAGRTAAEEATTAASSKAAADLATANNNAKATSTAAEQSYTTTLAAKQRMIEAEIEKSEALKARLSTPIRLALDATDKTNNLDSWWHKKRVRLTNNDTLSRSLEFTGSNTSTGGGGFLANAATVTFKMTGMIGGAEEPKLMHNCMQDLYFVMINPADRSCGWSLQLDDNYALAVRDNVVKMVKIDFNDVDQIWYIGAPHDSYSLRIRLQHRPNDYMHHQPDINLHYRLAVLGLDSTTRPYAEFFPMVIASR